MPFSTKGFSTDDKIIKKNVFCVNCFHFCKYDYRKKKENSDMSHYLNSWWLFGSELLCINRSQRCAAIHLKFKMPA